MTEDAEGTKELDFLRRWSRRKNEARRELVPQPEAQPELAHQASSAVGASALPMASGAAAVVAPEMAGSAIPPGQLLPEAPEAPGEYPPDGAPGSADRYLPSVDTLNGLASEYREFLMPNVSENLKRAALKKLFADPHFNKIDKFEAYSDDYTISETIPEDMLRAMNQSEGMFLPVEGKKPAGDSAGAAPAESASATTNQPAGAQEPLAGPQAAIAQPDGSETPIVRGDVIAQAPELAQVPALAQAPELAQAPKPIQAPSETPDDFPRNSGT